MNPTQLSHELREEQSADLTNRRWIVGLSLLGVAAGQIVSLYQTGIIKHLPDPPVPIFNSDKVDASDYAYKRLQTPDALMMVVTYGLTAWLAGAGGKNRAEDQPWLPIATGAKALLDVGTAAQLAREEWQENKAFCAYCQAATVASVASVALAVPEMIRAFRTIFRR
ncbi:vitamin K epoxide reductase [Fibrisoma montanum]|uniref:Vitamin K epoxide reductase n=1 Tax=Fibrisoma montanum TaxID=2305895 RepID=A0A418M6P5_9BACT|nr:vitamin K epoxide reductase family protein [Fibrisoma montanum]RIV21590.1 vitamin K epoxide reductase [Fibrisoma montanum]